MSRWPSTQLSGQGSSTEIDAALFDLLAKINALSVTDDELLTRILGLNVPTIIDSPTYGRYRAYPDGSTQGRVVTASVVRSSPVSLVTNTPKTICFIDVPSGKWSLAVRGGFILNSATSVSRFNIAISKSDITLPGSAMTQVPISDEIRTQDIFSALTGTTDFNTSISDVVVQLDVQTRFYFVSQSNFTANSCSAYGSIQAVSLL